MSSRKCEQGCSCKKHEPNRAGFRFSGRKATGFYMQGGHRYLTQQHGHPLANKNGAVAEHRKVLYDKLGQGPHSCHWCGKSLEWGGLTRGINVDHLDNDPLNNAPENLAPTCCGCNRVGTRRKARSA